MRWTTHGERPIYDSEWVRLALVDVELPDGTRFDHHVVRVPSSAAGTVVMRGEGDAREVLLLWRHRFITDTWGYEIPAGGVDPGESALDAAAREVLEETGWRPGPLRPVGSYHPSNGLSDQTFHVFRADDAQQVGEPVDAYEAERVEWLPLDEVRTVVDDGRLRDGLSLTSLLWVLSDLD